MKLKPTPEQKLIIKHLNGHGSRACFSLEPYSNNLNFWSNQSMANKKLDENELELNAACFAEDMIVDDVGFPIQILEFSDEQGFSWEELDDFLKLIAFRVYKRLAELTGTDSNCSPESE